MRNDRESISVANGAIVVLALLLSASRASAELMIVDSVEQMVADSDLVVRCRFAAIVDEPAGGRSTDVRRWQRATLAIDETFKGPPTASVDIRVASNPAFQTEFDRWRVDGGARLVLLQRSIREPDERDARAGYSFVFRARGWEPFGRQYTRSGTVAFSMDQRVLRTREEIEAVIRTAAREEASAQRSEDEIVELPPDSWPPWRIDSNTLQIDVPFNTPAYGELYSGSAVYLIVPLDKRIEATAAGWFDAGGNRVDEAIAVLRHFRNPANVERLRAALASPSWATSHYGGPAMRWTYPTRRIAYDALRAWGVDVPRPAIEMPADGYRAVTIRGALAAAAVAVAAFVAVAGAAHLLRRRAARPSVRAALFDAVCVASLTVVALVWWIDGRRAGYAPEIAGQVDATRAWASAHANGLTIVHATSWDAGDPLGTTLAVAAFDVAATPPQRWREATKPATDHAFAGFRYWAGTMASATGLPSPYAGVRVPLWFVAALAAAVPATRFVTIGTRAHRRHRRRRSGRCVACGYDLRGTDAGRCPECGGAVVRPT